MFSDSDPAAHPGAGLAAAPPALRDAATGFPAFGRYGGLIKDLRTAAWDGSLGLFSPRRTQRKTWVFLGAFSPRFMAGFAIVDAGLLATAFVYVFDRQTRELVEDKITVPVGFAPAFTGRLDQPWRLDSGDRQWRITPAAAPAARDGAAATAMSWIAEFESKRLKLRLDARCAGAGMSTVAAAPQRPFNFTWKACDLDLQVALVIDGHAHETPARGMIDFTLGYPPRRTFWNWAAAAGTADDQRVGLNLVAHFNNGLENALWLDGRIVPLAQASFIYDAAALERPWRVVTADGVLDLHFLPEGRRAENLNALVLGSRFTQMFGRYRGTLRLDGRPRELSAYGVTEEHHAVW